MSTEAAYIRASKSSHLEWKIEVADVDRLVAAGLVTESLATRLIRLRANFDAISASSNYRVMLNALSGFSETKNYLIAFARNEAARRKSPSTQIADEISDRVLDLFLDPNCPMCEGKGFTGSYGSPQIRCTACRESGKRRAFYRTDVEQHFAAVLESAIDSKVTSALKEMQRLLRA